MQTQFWKFFRFVIMHSKIDIKIMKEVDPLKIFWFILFNPTIFKSKMIHSCLNQPHL